MQNFLPKNYPHTYNRAASDLSSDAAPCVHEPVYPCVRVPVHPDVRLYRLRANSAARRQPSVLSISPSFSTPGTSTSPAICQPGCGATATATSSSASTAARSRDAATSADGKTPNPHRRQKIRPPYTHTAAVRIQGFGTYRNIISTSCATTTRTNIDNGYTVAYATEAYSPGIVSLA